MMQTNINIIFDFDGTLVDSFASVIDKFNLLADEFKFRTVRSDDIHQLKDLNSKQLIKYLDIPFYKIPSILMRTRAMMSNEMQHLPSFANMREIIQQMHQQNIQLGILTSNSAENVAAWLQCNGMESLFNFIHIESSYFGKHRVLKRILKKYKMNPAHTFYVGDETRDVESAKISGVNSIAVTWGFNSEKVLLQQKPSFIAYQPEDMLMICNQITSNIDNPPATH